MQKLNALWQLASAASAVRDMTQHTRTYHFAVKGAVTFYLRAENADVTVFRWARPMIEVTARLQGAFGWRILTDQDDAGVYIAAGRRAVVGGFSSARFEICVPHDTYLVLNLTGSSLTLQHLEGTLHVAPPDGAHSLITLRDR